MNEEMIKVGEGSVSDRLARVKKEKKRLTEIFNSASDSQQKIAVKVIDNIAFMTVVLEDLQQSILLNGCVSEYQNGENQRGTKQSPEVMTFLSMIGNFNKLVKQLIDILPEEDKGKASSALLDFMK